MGGTPTDQPVAGLVAAIRDGLAELADPARAEPMRAYMKSAMPFRGVGTPERRRLVRAALVDHPLPGPGAWLATVLCLWREAAFREERYSAIDLLTRGRPAKWLAPEHLDVVEELVTTGAWWDLVDPVATLGLGSLLRRHPEQVRPVVLDWSRAADLWLRRAAIICQIVSRQATDTELLAACIEANLDEGDFFIRKGIGWALREYSKRDPAWVAAFLDRHGERLSALSRREAAKHLPRAPRAS